MQLEMVNLMVIIASVVRQPVIFTLYTGCFT